ncbi:hypothetical protein J7643_02685 [bacterium]|nr:hypothetical protein [bacterium]
MAYKGIPEDLVTSVNPLELVGYLVSSGWQKIDRVKGQIALFRNNSLKGLFEVAVPLDPTYSDYFLRMADAIESLAEFEEKSPRELLATIAKAHNDQSDVLTSRLRTSAERFGGLPDLRVASSILAQLAKAIDVASEFERDTSEKPSEIAPFRLAHSRVGSYCIDVISPVNSQTDEQAIINRKAIERIMRGLSYAERATNNQNPSALINNTADGFDANLCKIFAEFCEELTDFDVDFSVNLSNKIESSLEVASPRLCEESAQYLWAAADAIKKDFEEFGTVTGGVLECHDRSRIPGAREGSGRRRVRVSFSDPDLGTRSRIITAYVSEDDYQKAMFAHGNRRMVRVSGTINKTTGRWIINAADSFEVLDAIIQNNDIANPQRTSQLSPASARVLRPRSGGSLIHKLRDAVEEGLLPKKFTRLEYYEWIRKHNVRHAKGAYSSETIRKTLDNFSIGSTSGTGGPTGALRRTTESVNGTNVTYFEFVE